MTRSNLAFSLCAMAQRKINGRSWLLYLRFVLGFLLCFVLERTIWSLSTMNRYLNKIESFQQRQLLQAPTTKKINNKQETTYKASFLEEYIWNHSSELGFNAELAQGCSIWTNPEATTPMIYKALNEYRANLLEYNNAVRSFSYLQDRRIVDIRKHLHEGICDRLELAPMEVTKTSLRTEPTSRTLSTDAYFSQSTSSNDNRHSSTGSALSYSSGVGYLEPLLPPMRNPNRCFKGKRQPKLLDVEYLVHDFANMCRSLTTRSRIVVLDLGASPKFMGTVSPWFATMELYRKFGFHVDHIYAYEVDQIDASKIYNGKLVPQHMLPAYHWINAGVSTEPGDPLHPWTMLEQEYTEEDLIIVKLDIDSPDLELTLAKQLIDSPKWSKLVDVLYFEHHVSMEEMNKYWKDTVRGTLQDSLDLFRQLREKGVASHSWV